MEKDQEAVREELKQMVAQMAATAPTMMAAAPAEFALGIAEVAYSKGITEGWNQASERIAAGLSR